jgi:hypothetical protein
MGAVASAVGDVFGGVAEAIFEPIKQVGNIASDVVREVGHAVESVGREVGKIGQAAVNDPVGTALKVAAVASGQWWALPLVSAGLVIANGGDIGQAALAAGISLAAQGVAYGVGEALGAGSSAGLDMTSADAVGLANQGLSSSQIAQVLGQSYPAIGSSAISQIADLASMGISASEIAADVGTQMAVQNLGASTAANSLGAGTRTALSGGNLSDVLSAAGTAGLGTGVGGATSLGLGQAGLGSAAAGAIGKGVGATVTSAAAGKDGTAAFLNSLINTTLSEAGAQTKNFLKGAWDKVTTAVGEYNTQLEKTNATQAEIAPLEQDAKTAEAAVNAELAAYQPVRDKFSDLVKQYDAAKAAGDVTLANSLADQANALIPELNAATEKYNNVYNDYSAKLNTYSTAVDGYKADIAKTDELKAGYEKTSEELAAETKKLTDAAAKVVTLAEPVQNAFAKMYQSGTSIDEALANSDKLNSMSTVAQETFNRDIAQNNNTESALAFADKVNSLDTKQQAAFQTGITTGLNDTTAFEVAPIISNYNTQQQQAYVGAVKEGYGKEGADLISAFASFAPEQTTQTPSTTPAAPAELDVATAFTKLDRQEQEKFKELVNDPTNPMSTADALKAASDFFITPAAAGTLPATTSEVNATYHQTAPGVWSVVGKDPSGKEITLVDLAQSTGTPFIEGASAGKYTISSDSSKEGGFSVVPTAPTGTTMTPAEEDAYQKELAAIDAAQSGTQTTPSTSTGQGTATGPTIPSFDTSTATTPTADFTAPATTTGTGGATTGTATNTTGAAGTTGTTGGATTGGTTVGGAGTGTGTGLGTTDGTGTGTGGTGTGTGSGTGGSGTGIGIGAGTAGTGYAGWQALQSQDQYGGIKNLTPGLTQRMDYSLAGLPTDSGQDTVNPMSQVPSFAAGGTPSSAAAYDPYSTKDVSGSGLSGSLTPGLSKAQISYILSGLPGSNISVQGRAEGGAIEGHNPEFYSEGGLSSMDNRYVQGEGDGTSDSVPAMLANGEYVISADIVSALGNGSNESGAGILDKFMQSIRSHKTSNGDKGLPEDSKGPLAYLLDAQKQKNKK